MFSTFFGNGYESYDDEEQPVSEEEQATSSESEDEQPKSMADYYNDLEAVIAKVRSEVKHADKDPGFKRAVKVLEEVIDLCRNIESSMNPVTVYQTNEKRSKLLKTIGSDSIIDVTGEASKLLAIHYREMMIAMATRKYWPNPPLLAAPLVHARYESELEKRANDTWARIQKYQDRIDAYEASKNKQPSGEVQRRRPQ